MVGCAVSQWPFMLYDHRKVSAGTDGHCGHAMMWFVHGPLFDGFFAAVWLYLQVARGGCTRVLGVGVGVGAGVHVCVVCERGCACERGER